MSLCDWFYIIERNELMDFAPTHFDHMFLVLTPQPAKLDLNLFLRPFQTDTWILILTLLAMMCITSYLVRYCLPSDYERTEAFKTVSFVSMLFFVVVNAFYGGAMTMFFASSVKLPFQDRRDVLRDNSWSLIVQNGIVIQLN